MPATKDVLRHVVAEVAGAKRKCARKPTKHVIAKGELCIVVKDGQYDKHNYCVVCASDILRLAQTRLDDLVNQIKKVE